MKDFRFFLITDTHFFSNSLGAYGEGYENFMMTEQKCFAETEAINRATFDYLRKSDEADTVLIAGDLSFNGEKQSHMEFRKLLLELKESGKKVYVVTAGHDIKKDPFCFPGTDDKTPAEGIRFSDLYDIYGEFGYDSAIELNRRHMSYVAQLTDGLRLLVLCGDTAEGSNVPYSKEFFGWVKAQLDKARLDGQTVIAMEHYPVLPGQPVLSFIDDARVSNSEALIRLLADNGCHLIFTGHMHNQSVNEVTTPLGNKFYDVCTGSVIGCPAFMRLCTVEDSSTVKIESIPVPDFEWDKKGLTGEEYLKKQFDSMIINLITGLRDNPVKTMRKIHMKQNPALEKILRKVGASVSEATVGGFAKLFGVKAEPEIKNNSLLELLTDIARCIFVGDQPFTDKTPEGRLLLKILGRFKPILSALKLHGCQGEKIDAYEMIKHSIGNYGLSDYNVTLHLK